MALRVVRSACRGCHGGCGVLVEAEGNRVVRITGDPQCPVNRGRLCIKGKRYHTITHHPDRLTTPLRRKNGAFEKISWEDALDEIAERFLKYKKEFGAESVVPMYGTGRDNESFIYRFGNAFGTPNVAHAGHMCYGPRIAVGLTRCGGLPVVDYEGGPACVIVWGANPLVSNADEYKGHYLAQAMKKGCKIICVDPRRSMVAKKAHIWLRIRPGTDGALAWGMVNAVLEKRLYDKDFVENYVHGWEEFRRRALKYPLIWAAEKTGLSEEEIRGAAEMFARTKPAGIHWGVSLEQTKNCINNITLLLCLTAMTGNLDRPGGAVFFGHPATYNVTQLGLFKELPKEAAKKRLGGERFRLGNQIGAINPKAVWDAVLEEKPYPVKALFLMSTNPVITRANSREVMKALKAVDFLVAADFFMTPSARQAHIVLPSSTWLEHDYVADLWKWHGWVLARKKVVQVGEARSDYEILNELGKRCTDPNLWWPSIEDSLNEILSPSGLTWEEFCHRGYLQVERRFRKHLKGGFRTPSGKVEFKSNVMEKIGYDPLPGYVDPPETPWSNPAVAETYPYQLITGARSPFFFHSENRVSGPLRSKRPDPLVEIHPDLAAAKKIHDGDWVVIASPKGRVVQKAVVTDRVPSNVVSADHGWWFPEKQGDFAWDRSNIDILTDNAFDSCDPAMGSTNLRVLLCDVYKATGKVA